MLGHRDVYLTIKTFADLAHFSRSRQRSRVRTCYVNRCTSKYYIRIIVLEVRIKSECVNV